jgi:3',5'-cyclic-AMP phosphodiesterase
MTDPFLIVQLSDPHIGANWSSGDPLSSLAVAIAAVRSIRPRPGAILISGDLAHNAAESEYAAIQELLEPLGLPVFVVAGNHDDREVLRRHFDLAGAGAEPIRYAADIGPIRLLVLDSTIPGKDGGQLDSEQLDWLESELAANPGTPVVVALHHPPFATGLPPFDRIGLAPEDTAAFAAVVARHKNVQRIVAGHVHRSITSEVGGRPALTAPSTYEQALLDFSTEELVINAQPIGFAVHVLIDGKLVSHFHAVEASP